MYYHWLIPSPSRGFFDSRGVPGLVVVLFFSISFNDGDTVMFRFSLWSFLLTRNAGALNEITSCPDKSMAVEDT